MPVSCSAVLVKQPEPVQLVAEATSVALVKRDRWGEQRTSSSAAAASVAKTAKRTLSAGQASSVSVQLAAFHQIILTTWARAESLPMRLLFQLSQATAATFDRLISGRVFAASTSAAAVLDTPQIGRTFTITGSPAAVRLLKQARRVKALAQTQAVTIAPLQAKFANLAASATNIVSMGRALPRTLISGFNVTLPATFISETPVARVLTAVSAGFSLSTTSAVLASIGKAFSVTWLTNPVVTASTFATTKVQKLQAFTTGQPATASRQMQSRNEFDVFQDHDAELVNLSRLTLAAAASAVASFLSTRTVVAVFTSQASASASIVMDVLRRVVTGISYFLKVAFNEAVAGLFTLDSSLDGTDVLSDSGLFAGTFDDVSDDAKAPYQVVFGTNNLMSQMQAANLTVKVARIDDPGYWNPNNPASPLNAAGPGFVPMRPVQLRANLNGTEYGIFRGFIRHATWDSSSRSCELYCEDLLLWASRVFPTIQSTGPTTTGAVVALLFAQVDPTVAPICDTGSPLDDFTADGTRSVTDLLGDLLTVDLGTVFVNGDGVPVYEQADTPLVRASAATVEITSQASQEQSGIDLDQIGTRVTVTKTDPATGTTVAQWSRVDAAAEHVYGRSDLPQVTSPYVSDGEALAEELVIRGTQGKPPIQFTLANVDDATLLLMLQSNLQSVFTISDTFGGITGDVIVQQITHTINTGIHQAEYTAVPRSHKAFTLDSALDGTDTLRYP